MLPKYVSNIDVVWSKNYRGKISREEFRKLMSTPRWMFRFRRLQRRNPLLTTCPHGIRYPNTNTDLLEIPAIKRWTFSDGSRECVSFRGRNGVSGYGSWRNLNDHILIVPSGGYFDARNPGYGRSPSVCWNLRTGGFVNQSGYHPPEQINLPN